MNPESAKPREGEVKTRQGAKSELGFVSSVLPIKITSKFSYPTTIIFLCKRASLEHLACLNRSPDGRDMAVLRKLHRGSAESATC